MTDIEWQWVRFAALDGADVHAMLALRQQVFMLEQRCLYPDIDGRDPLAWHLLGWRQHADERELIAYLRCFAPGTLYAEAAIGRVVIAMHMRKQGVGGQLMQEGLRHIEREYPGTRVRLSAQAHLQSFYAGLGFAGISDVYLEDDIPHIDMLRE